MKIGKIIKDYCDSHDMSIRELARKMDCSHSYLSTLIKGKRNDRDNAISPSLEFLKSLADAMGTSLNDLCALLDTEDVGLPVMLPKRIAVLGVVRAGIPYDAEENILDYVEISPNVQGEYFALKLKGDSMSPRMCEGDIVIVRKQESVENGDIAIVLVNGNEATCKRVFFSNDGISLVGLNPSFSPINYSQQDVISKPVQIIGKVVEIRAKF